MILKQRFAEGNTNYIDLGDTFVYRKRGSEDFETLLQRHLNTDAYRRDCIGFVLFGDKHVEPIYRDFPQWVYSNDGKLFMTLNTL